MFEVSWDSERHILLEKLSGFWEMDEMRAYEDRIRALIRSAAGQPFDSISDLNELAPQCAEIVKRHEQIMSDLDRAGRRRNIIVISSALLRRQVARSTPVGKEPEYFESLEDAERALRR